jgi:hypothetical protein
MKKSQRGTFLALWIAVSFAAFLCIAGTGTLGEFFSYIFLFPIRLFDVLTGQDIQHIGPGTQAFLANSAIVALTFMGVIRLVSKAGMKSGKRKFSSAT